MPSSKPKSKWRLNSNHDIELIAAEKKYFDGKETVSLKGEITGTASDEITCIVTSKKERDVEVARILKLKGSWRADESNRLTFLVSKEDGYDDILLFDGAWEVGKDNEILYRYKKTRLKRKTKEERSLIFKGRWQITAKDRLAYILDTSGKSGFIFKTEFEGAGISGRFGALKYRVGIGVSRYKRPIEKVIKFLGAARWDINRRDALEFEFIGAEGRKSGMAVTLTRKLLGGKAFLGFRKLAEESRVEAGVKIPW